MSREVGALLGTIEEPLSRADLTLLRHLVVEHKAAERRHRFPAVLHLGGPGRPEVGRVAEGDADLDHALRCDVLEAMLAPPGTGPLMTWLTRPGDLEPQDVDLAWLRGRRRRERRDRAAAAVRRRHPRGLARPPLGRRPHLAPAAGPARP